MTQYIVLNGQKYAVTETKTVAKPVGFNQSPSRVAKAETPKRQS